MINGLGLGDAYDETIRRIKAQEGDKERLGIAALMWISHSERPLKADEICHALAVEVGSADINIDNVPSIRTVLSCCQGLAVVDERSSTIRLIHFTLGEYLSGHADLFHRPHSKIAETCLTYLNFRAIKDLSASSSRDLGGRPSLGSSTYRRTDMEIELLGRPPFLGYSSLYWGAHMRMDPSDRSRDLALNLLDQYDSHISAELLFKSTVVWYLYSFTPFSALRSISHFGIVEVAIDLIRTKGWDVNQRDREGLTLLMWAARYGRKGIVKFLLQQEHTQPDMADTEHGRTALSFAAGSGHGEVVKLFLGPLFVNPRSIGRWRGATQVVSLLFGRKYVNPDRPDKDGRTPLWWAVWSKYNGVVKLLLGREEVTPDRPDNYGRTPLSQAAENGSDGIVKLLLGRGDVSPDRPDTDGQTPLLWAARTGRDGVVKLLLGREDVSPDRPDTDGKTPLWWAARDGRDGAVKLLLEREDVSPNRPDKGDQTPLLLAARNGHEGVVELLLAREDVSPDIPDNYDRTPLSWAAYHGRDGVAKLLLGRGDVNPDRPDKCGQTPLIWATLYGHKGVVGLLKARDAAGASTG